MKADAIPGTEVTRLAPVDGLRGIAALGVAVFHLYPDQTFWLWSFVDLFFVLSGLVITRLLLEVPQFNGRVLRNFWIRRAIRIWPVYYLTLIGALLLGTLLHHYGRMPVPYDEDGGLWRYFTFLQFTELYDRSVQPTEISYVLMFLHSWSLAVEEQFYIVWALLIMTLRQRPLLLQVFCLLLIAAAPAMRAAEFNPQLLLTRMDGLAMGSLIAVSLHQPAASTGARNPAWLAPWITFIGLALTVPFLITGFQRLDFDWMWDNYPLTWVITGFNLFFTGIVLQTAFAPQGRLARSLSHPWLLYLGSISFAFYMFHQPLLSLYKTALREFHTSRHLILDLVYVGAVLLSAHLSREYFEKFFNRYKHRYPMH